MVPLITEILKQLNYHLYLIFTISYLALACTVLKIPDLIDQFLINPINNLKKLKYYIHLKMNNYRVYDIINMYLVINI